MAKPNLESSYIVLPTAHVEWIVEQFAMMVHEARASSSLSERGPLTIDVRLLPEGVFLGTSEDLPGLIVEAGSRDELIDTARSMALELLELDGLPTDRQLVFYFKP